MEAKQRRWGLLKVTYQVIREREDRARQWFTSLVRKHFGERAADVVGWYVTRIYIRYVWEQTRRIQLEEIILEHCPRLMPEPPPFPAAPSKPSWINETAPGRL